MFDETRYKNNVETPKRIAQGSLILRKRVQDDFEIILNLRMRTGQIKAKDKIIN